jgi:hypothetical protein
MNDNLIIVGWNAFAHKFEEAGEVVALGILEARCCFVRLQLCLLQKCLGLLILNYWTGFAACCVGGIQAFLHCCTGAHDKDNIPV